MQVIDETAHIRAEIALSSDENAAAALIVATLRGSKYDSGRCAERDAAGYSFDGIAVAGSLGEVRNTDNGGSGLSSQVREWLESTADIVRLVRIAADG